MSEDKSQAQGFGIQSESVEAIRMSLSDTEKEVFDMIRGGLNFEEIGKKLQISTSAVRVLFMQIRGKVSGWRDGADLHPPKKNAPTEEMQSRYPLRGTLLFYNDPTAPVGEDDWNALK